MSPKIEIKLNIQVCQQVGGGRDHPGRILFLTAYDAVQWLDMLLFFKFFIEKMKRSVYRLDCMLLLG